MLGDIREYKKNRRKGCNNEGKEGRKNERT